MKNVFIAVEVIITILLIGSILLQVKGTGLSSAFGGGGEFYQSKRGVEKIVLYVTVFLVVLFAIISLALLVTP